MLLLTHLPVYPYSKAPQFLSTEGIFPLTLNTVSVLGNNQHWLGKFQKLGQKKTITPLVLSLLKYAAVIKLLKNYSSLKTYFISFLVALHYEIL